jgi:hypothetical protein
VEETSVPATVGSDLAPAAETGTESIGRVAHLLTHAAHQLPALLVGHDTFEDIRARYGKAMTEVALEGRGRVTAPRTGVGTPYRYWASTRDLIKEFQAIGWIEPGIPAPASKGTVDSHRSRRYPLTAEGARVARDATGRRALADALTDALIGHHVYVRTLLGTLAQAPLFCPVVSDGQVSHHPSRRYWAEHVSAVLATEANSGARDAEFYETRLAEDYRRRFGARRREGLRPSAKEVAELFTDSFASFALEARGLRFGSTTLDQLKGWGAELRLLDQSRYVPSRSFGNLIWLTSDLVTGPDGKIAHARRRLYADYGLEVARALIAAYFEERARPSEDSTPEDPKTTGAYRPIHVIRAAAAVRTGTARELGDRALDDLATGRLDLGVRVRLLPARLELPPTSERSGRIRAVHLTMSRENESKHSKEEEQQ